MLQTFSVVIPKGLRTGQQFRASLGGQITLISIPPNSKENDTIYVQIKIEENSNALYYIIKIPNNVSPGQAFPINVSSQIIWITCPYDKWPGDTLTLNLNTKLTLPKKIDKINDILIEWPEPLKIPENLNADEISKYFICPITNCIMTQPAITPYGITYEYGALMKWLETKQIDPVINKFLSRNQLYPNRSIRDMIEEFISFQGTIVCNRGSCKSDVFEC